MNNSKFINGFGMLLAYIIHIAIVSGKKDLCTYMEIKLDELRDYISGRVFITMGLVVETDSCTLFDIYSPSRILDTILTEFDTETLNRYHGPGVPIYYLPLSAFQIEMQKIIARFSALDMKEKKQVLDIVIHGLYLLSVHVDYTSKVNKYLKQEADLLENERIKHINIDIDNYCVRIFI